MNNASLTLIIFEKFSIYHHHTHVVYIIYYQRKKAKASVLFLSCSKKFKKLFKIFFSIKILKKYVFFKKKNDKNFSDISIYYVLLPYLYDLFH